jgi:hypothetical protein
MHHPHRLSTNKCPAAKTRRRSRGLSYSTSNTRRMLGLVIVTLTYCYCWTVLSVLPIHGVAAVRSSRQLAIGDFASINQVLQSATFALPPRSGTEDSTTLRLTEIICRNVRLGDAQLDYDIGAGGGGVGSRPIHLPRHYIHSLRLKRLRTIHHPPDRCP